MGRLYALFVNVIHWLVGKSVALVEGLREFALVF